MRAVEGVQMSEGTQGLRVERDGRGPRTTFEEIEIGRELGPMTWIVEPGNVKGLLDNDQDIHEWYIESSPFGKPVVPPMATYPPVRVLFSREYNVRGLFYSFEAEFIRPIFYGEEITISGAITDKWIKRDREYVSYGAEGRDDVGELVFTTRRTHVLDYLPRTVPRGAEGVDSGVAAG